MKVRNVHSRELTAPPTRVGAVLDSLGGEDDQLWPIDRWPAMPFQLEGPLTVGAHAGHGSIRYAVEEYEPGRRLVFRFAPKLGLEGTHRFDVEPLGPDRSLLTHTLECLVRPKLLPLWPIVRGYHDALLEDVLDQAELAATGRRAGPGRWPVWLRVANAVDVRTVRRREKLSPATREARGLGVHADRLARLSGVAVPAVLAAIGALHASWALGLQWPAGSERELAELVLSQRERGQLGSELPPAPLTAAVAGALLGAAAIVRAVHTGTHSRALRGAAWVVAGVFLARGALFIPMDLIGGLDDTYERLDLAIYSPLCLALGGGTAWLLTRAGQTRFAAIA